jgi:hypothetical protein
MDTPLFKIGDKIYRWVTGFKPPACPTCKHDNYTEDSYDNTDYWTIEVTQSEVLGIRIDQGILECGDGVSYQLDNESWLIDEKSLYASHAGALAAANAHVRRLQVTSEIHRKAES